MPQQCFDTVGGSARMSDIQHIAVFSMIQSAKTISFTAWQTKVADIIDDARPMPLLSTKHSLSGEAWWKPLVAAKDTLPSLDHLLSAPTSTG